MKVSPPTRCSVQVGIMWTGLEFALGGDGKGFLVGSLLRRYRTCEHRIDVVRIGFNAAQMKCGSVDDLAILDSG